MLHGSPSPSEMFLPLARRLADRYRSIIPDLPGYGRSPAGNVSLDAVTRGLREELARRGVDSLHGIVGFSGGAWRALHFALYAGMRVEVAACVGSLVGLDHDTKQVFRQFAEGLTIGSITLEQARALSSERNLSSEFRARRPEEAVRVGAWLDATTPDTLAAELTMFADAPDLLPELHRLRSRVYLRVGADDTTTPPAMSRAISSQVPGASVDVVAGCSHALFVEDADATEVAIAAALG